MAALKDKMQELVDSFDHLSGREKAMLVGLVGTFAFLLVGGLWFFIDEGLSQRETRCEKLRSAVTLLDRHDERLREAQMADARADAKIQSSVPMLQGHLDKIAKELEVEVKEYKSLKKRPLGKEKKYVEKSMRLRIYGVKVGPLSLFLDRIEGGRHLILVSALDVQTQVGKPEMLDVDMVVSTYEKVGKSKAKKSSRKGKGKGKKSKNKRTSRGGRKGK